MTDHALLIIASAQGQEATSTKLARALLDGLNPSTVTTRDLSAGMASINQAWVKANFTAEAERSAAQRDTLALSESLIAEVQAADTLVITCPIYNFGVSSALKAWIDQICRAGQTFNYTESGPVGLLSGKRAYIIVTSGGVPVGSAVDFASPHLTQVLRFIGIEAIQVIAADQQVMDDQSVARAEDTIRALIANTAKH